MKVLIESRNMQVFIVTNNRRTNENWRYSHLIQVFFTLFFEKYLLLKLKFIFCLFYGFMLKPLSLLSFQSL